MESLIFYGLMIASGLVGFAFVVAVVCCGLNSGREQDTTEEDEA